jgi:hypothetical protein
LSKSLTFKKLKLKTGFSISADGNTIKFYQFLLTCAHKMSSPYLPYRHLCCLQTWTFFDIPR